MKKVEERFAVHLDDYKHYDTQKLRKHFLIDNVFTADAVEFTYTHYERLMVGGVMPVNQSVKLESYDQLKSDYFLQRRELGAINIGGAGKVSVDGEIYEKIDLNNYFDYKENWQEVEEETFLNTSKMAMNLNILFKIIQ